MLSSIRIHSSMHYRYSLEQSPPRVYHCLLLIVLMTWTTINWLICGACLSNYRCCIRNAFAWIESEIEKHPICLSVINYYVPIRHSSTSNKHFKYVIIDSKLALILRRHGHYNDLSISHEQICGYLSKALHAIAWCPTYWVQMVFGWIYFESMLRITHRITRSFEIIVFGIYCSCLNVKNRHDLHMVGPFSFIRVDQAADFQFGTKNND